MKVSMNCGSGDGDIVATETSAWDGGGSSWAITPTAGEAINVLTRK